MNYIPKIKLIVARDKGFGIGFRGSLLYKNKKDLEIFKMKTTNHIVVMGRKTFKEISKPLPNRINVVMTRKGMKDIPEGVILANDIGPIFRLAQEKKKDIFIIGGSEIYDLWDEMIDEYHLTIFPSIKKADRHYYKTFQNDDFDLISKTQFDDFEIVVLSKK